MGLIDLGVVSVVALAGAVGLLVTSKGRRGPWRRSSRDDRTRSRPRRFRRIGTVAATVAGVLAVMGSVAVSGPTAHAAGTPYQVVATGGTPQSETVGGTFTLTATVEDNTGLAVPGPTAVTFTAPSGGASGTFGGSSTFLATTDSNGVATATLTADDTSGPFAVAASSPGLLSATFSLTNTAGLPAQLVPTSGSGQTVAVGARAGTPLSVTVEDQYGNVVTTSAAPVTFSAPGTGAGGSFAGPSPTIVDATAGVASAPAFTANTTVGSYLVTATALGFTATFSLTNGPGATSKLGSVVGDLQTAHIGSAFGSPLSVTAYDAYGHAVPGVSVTFTAPAKGACGTFAGSSSGSFTGITDASGVVTTPTFTANGTPGLYAVTITAGGTWIDFLVENYTVAAAPTILTASAEDASAKVRWSAPASNGFSAITGYLITASNGAQLQVGVSTSALFSGLVNGDSYSFTVAAVNAAGAGPSSGASNTVTPVNSGYWMVASDGGIFSFGTHQFYGSTGSLHLNRPIVGMAATPDDGGYWLVASDGGIFSFGDAHFYGSTGSLHLDAPIVGMTPTSDGRGYWLVASDGGIFAFGDAGFHGSTGGRHLDAPIVGMAATVEGAGYWLVASDGGIFSFGSAKFYGSTGGLHLNRPIVALAPTANSHGYWLVASDGGIFAFGNADFLGSTGGLALNRPIVGMAD